jgi:hypothetical protein
MGLLPAGAPTETPKQIGAGGKAAADVHDAELVDEDADDEPRKGA